MPFISVIVPVFNSEQYIYKTLLSVKNQTYPFFEVIIIDDGSTDNTKLECMKILEDHRFHYYYIENAGVSHARNFGMSKVQGDWIVFLDGDDEFNRDTLQYVAKVVEKEPTDLVCFGYEKISKGKNCGKCQLEEKKYKRNELPVAVRKIYESGCMNVVWNKAFKNEILLQNNIQMDESLWIGEDFMFVIDYMDHISSINTLSYIGYRYTIDSNGLTKKTRNNELEKRIIQEQRLEQFVAKHGGDTKFVQYAFIKICLNYLQHSICNYELFCNAVDESASNPTIEKAYNIIKSERSILSFIASAIMKSRKKTLFLFLKTKFILENLVK